MDNAQAAERLVLFGDLLDLSEDNPFRARAYQNAARSVSGLPQPFGELIDSGRITDVPGIGKGVAASLKELHATGQFAELETLLERIPAGVLEMRRVPGLGAKKLRALYRDSGIRSLEELEKICQDGTLAAMKGYGAKSVAGILDGIHQVRSFIGQWRRPKALAVSASMAEWLSACEGVQSVMPAGALRRNMETLSELVWVVTSLGRPEALLDAATKSGLVQGGEPADNGRIRLRLAEGITGEIVCARPDAAGWALLEATGPSSYVQMVLERGGTGPASEEDCVAKAGVPWIPPECRDLESLWTGVPADLITPAHLRGVLHCHSTYSDGKATLKEMVEAAAQRGLTYFGICDHSRSAAYAGGLTIERVAEQHREVEALNEQYAGRLRIFRGIESDILVDGSLDYPDEVLASFDFVVASVHSGLGMDEETATERVCRAVRNRYTTILGHSTGRLLLMRRGFPLNMEKVVEAAREAGTVIELNGNPRRLDVDWRHLPLMFGQGVRTSINPDAHSLAGLDDMLHGVAVARKAGTTPAQVLNCMEADEIARYFKEARG